MSKDKRIIENRLYSEEDKGTIQFYQLSKEIINHKKYRELSFGAKILYSILFDRLQLSIHNKWRDEQGRYYLQFKVKPAQGDLRSFDEKTQSERSLTEVMNANAKTVGKYKKELKEAGLLLEEKEGFGRVSRLYLAKPFAGEEIPPETTHKLPLREGIMPPKKGRRFPPNDTDLNKTNYSDIDFNQINHSKKEKTESKEKINKNDLSKIKGKTDMIDRSNTTAINPLLSSVDQKPMIKQNKSYKSPEEVHNTLADKNGKALLGEGIAIIQNKRVSKYGYEKYLTKVMEDLAGRRKSQEQFRVPLDNSATPFHKTAFHLKESRYRGMSEDALNAKLQRKSEALKKEQSITDCSFSRHLSYS